MRFLHILFFLLEVADSEIFLQKNLHISFFFRTFAAVMIYAGERGWEKTLC